MRRSAGLLILALATSAGRAQGDRLTGRWEGTVQAPQGERKAAASFKKEAAGYTGTITGLRGDIAFKEVKVEGDKIHREKPFCPKCGAGVFLAKHADRVSCGRCGYTEFAGK